MSNIPKSGIIEIDGFELNWEIRHLGGASNLYENYRGLSVSVVHTKENQRGQVSTINRQMSIVET